MPYLKFTIFTYDSTCAQHTSAAIHVWRNGATEMNLIESGEVLVVTSPNHHHELQNVAISSITLTI
jgi:hypothetical protein